MDAVHAPGLQHFLCSYDDVLARIDAIDPRAYDRSRGCLDGATTWLSPFLTHGIVSTRTVATRVLANHRPGDCYRLLFELAWREYFHREWQIRGHEIFTDIRQPQEQVESEQLPLAIVRAETGISALDACLRKLLSAGTLHNHARMWVAGIVCNTAHTAWYQPARWMHYHLLDGDLASNTLSWQWIAGSFSHKRYIANQDNINKYSRTRQHGSWLDVPYATLESLATPQELSERTTPELPVRVTDFAPVPAASAGNSALRLRSLWDLDPVAPGTVQSIVYVDTALDDQWPMSENRWQFIRHWAGLCNAPIVAGTPAALQALDKGADIERVEYPACRHWPGMLRERNWLFSMPHQPFRSFSQYWKLIRAEVGL